MNSKHTPGPWQVTPMPDGSIEITRKAGCHIAVMLYTGYPGQVKDNALLIAAAPDLYLFVASKAESGDNEALELLERIHGNAKRD